MTVKKRDLFSKNIEDIRKILLEKKMYSLRELNEVLTHLKTKKLIAQNISGRSFFNMLQNRLELKTYSISSEKINKVRYTLYSDINVYDFVATFEKQGFFSMSTSLNIQGLSNEKNEFVFFSKELTPKYYNKNNEIHQEDIDQAYEKEYRYTSSIATYKNNHVIYLTPKHTGRFEVVRYNEYYVSSVHRAFVEMIIHVQYFKSFETVIEIFKPLKNRLDVKRIFKVLEIFDLIYPYHQLIGFSLEKVGFYKNDLDLFKKQVSDLKFYTQKSKIKYTFDSYWNIYY